MVKKEATIAIFIGLLIGLLITGGILRARRAMQIPKESEEKPSQQETPQQEYVQEENTLLNIVSPDDNSVVNESTITITGRAPKETYIAIIAEKSEHLIVPNDAGSFSQEVSLIKGANIIKITVYTESGEKEEKTLNIVYTTAEI